MPGLAQFHHIAIEGPIGVGKSSLARRLATHLGGELLLERPQDNPFLERFYGDMPGYALQVQPRVPVPARQAGAHARAAGHVRAAGRQRLRVRQGRLFARLNLSDDEYRLYAQMHAQVAPQVPEPDLVIWLQAGPTALMQRIRQRGIGMEQGITEGYLQRLCDAYVEYFHAYDAAPVFAVGTEHFNPVDDDADFALFVDRLVAFRGRREFFNSHVELRLG